MDQFQGTMYATVLTLQNRLDTKERQKGKISSSPEFQQYDNERL